MNKQEETIYGMLTENTGTHFLDSGGADGRGWQRNARKSFEDFLNEDEESYEFDYEYGDIVRIVSVFHYLTNNLELDAICDEFNKIQEESDDWDADADVYGVSKNAYDYIDSCFEVEIERTWNTYNGDSDLSQILQGANLKIDDEDYVLIQIHNGADARGGYTDAKLFKCDEYGMIHEYLHEYKDSYELNEDMSEGYIETFTDYYDAEKTYTLIEVQSRIQEINK
jgi:hypothetical protein